MSAYSRMMGHSSLVPLKVPCFNLIEAMQKSSDPAVQLDALALTFTAVCQSLGLDPHELVLRAKNQLIDADAVRNPHIEAIRDYAAGELA